MKFKGKVVLITGASSGIGAGTAIHFASLGASLALVGRNQDNLNEVAGKCRQVAGAGDVLVIAADIMKEFDVERMIEETLKKFRKLDVLVNNAGIVRSGGILNSSLSDLDEIFATNVRGVYHLTMLAAPHLIKTKGSIVNVSSVAGTRPFPTVTAYSMSKSALDQFTKCVALELASKGVRVNSVNPAVIDTPIFKTIGVSGEDYKKFLELCKKMHPLGRHGTVEEVAHAIAFLAGDEASFVTGELLHVDGGRRIMTAAETLEQ